VEAFWQRNHILWGQGGNRPGVHIYDVDTRQTNHECSLPAGQSVYSLDMSPDGSRLAVGTKSNLLYHVRCFQQNEENGQIEFSKIVQGYAVLSICFWDSDRVVAADVSGRCLLWHLEDTQHPRELPTGCSTVYSLFRLTDGSLAGLALDGKLLTWKWPARRIARKVDISLAPEHSALVKPVYWASSGAWAWPGRNGIIMLWPDNSDEVSIIEAHSCDVYAVSVCGDRLVTVGRKDGKLKIWNCSETEPSQQYTAPLGVIAATAWTDPEPNFILADDRGSAGLYTVNAAALCFVQGLQGRDFRVFFGPDQACLELAASRRRTRRAQDVADEIRRIHRDQEPIDAKELHDELVQLGYEHVSFELRAEAARQRDDLISELKYSKQVAELISYEEPGAEEFLLRYMELLELLWQHVIAHRLGEQLVERYPHDELIESVRRLQSYTECLNAGGFVIESDVSLNVLTRTAEIMGTPSCGRYNIARHDPIHTDVSDLAPSDLIGEYDRLCAGYRDVSLPQAKQVKVSWLSATEIEHVDMVVFDGARSSPVPGLEFALKIYDAGLQTILVPVALFNTDSAREIASSEYISKWQQHGLQNETASNGWLLATERLVRQAVGIAINQKRRRHAYFSAAEDRIVSNSSLASKETWGTLPDQNRIQVT
jgi:hypothetical protein